MSSPQMAVHRRRSHSAASSASHHRLDDTWRPATKRAYLQQSSPSATADNSPSLKMRDVEWRSKRRRRDDSPTSMSLDISPQNSSPDSQSFPSPVHQSYRFHDRIHSPRSRRPTFDSALSLSSNGHHESRLDMKRLRSEAFWELQRSIEEGGESLIRRMRDYESTRMKSGVHTKLARERGRKRSSINIPTRNVTVAAEVFGDEDDDIQIFSSPVCDVLPLRHKPRASSLSEDSPVNGAYSSLDSRGRSPSPCTSSSVYPSDDESLDPCSMFGEPARSPIPALSTSTAESSNSSLTSLPLSAPATSAFTFRYSPSASRTEKALAALSLAMANGAGSINDYECLRSIDTACMIDDCEVGEMWH